MRIKQLVYAGISVISMGLLSGGASAVTWCGPTKITDVICYADGSCAISADAYGLEYSMYPRYFALAPGTLNEEKMYAAALSALMSDGYARMAFVDNGLDCSNVPQGSQIYGLGAIK